MEKKVVNAENELSIAANKINNYGEFLCRSIEKYIAILAKIQNGAIKDQLISAKLSNLASQLKPYRSSVLTECENISSYVKSDINEIEKADSFKFTE